MIFGKTFGQDFLASIVVFLVALPLCMGIAIASGVPPAAGLITGIVGGLVVGFLAGSPLQVSGPAAGLAVIVWELVNKHGIEVLGIIVLLAGVIQLGAGVLRWGRYFRAISPPVIYGMLAGIGVLIFGAQFHVMVDDSPKGNGLTNLITIPAAIYKGIFPVDGSSHHLAAMIGIITILAILAWGRFRPVKLHFVPAPLLAVVAATAIAAIMNLPIKYVDVPSNLLSAVNLPSAASFAMITPALLGAALAMAVIASAETLLCAVAVDRMHSGPKTNFDRELAAQGVGNILCGFLGALPMTGVIVRSSANVEGGAKTRLSAVIHGGWLLAFVAALPFVLRMIPTASLAAILVYTGYKLVNPANIRSLAQYGKTPLAIYLATLIGIVSTDLLTGVLVGIGLSVARLVYSVTHLDLKVERIGRHQVHMHLKGSATFVALPKLAAALDETPPGSELHVHVEQLTHIDHACLDAFRNWEEQGEAAGGKLVMEWHEVARRYGREELPALLRSSAEKSAA